MGKIQGITGLSALVPNKIMEKMLLETMLGHTENEMIGDSHYVFPNSKLCLTNLFSTYDKVTAMMNERRATYVIYQNLCKVFDTTLHAIIFSKV